jgi:hypothetical protein
VETLIGIHFLRGACFVEAAASYARPMKSKYGLSIAPTCRIRGTALIVVFVIVCPLYVHLSTHCKFGNLPKFHSRLEYARELTDGKQNADGKIFAAAAGGFPGASG